MLIEPYLYFDGRCDEAIEFYKTAIGAEVTMLMRFKDCPDPGQKEKFPSGIEDKVMHASLRIGDSRVMVSDGRCTGHTKFDGFSLSISVASAAEADKLFAALAEGGKVIMALAKTFFSPSYGMLTDRFGVKWMIMAGHLGQMAARLEFRLKTEQNKGKTIQGKGDTMINAKKFDETLRQLLNKDTFVPFYVELKGGKRILIRQPVLAFGGGWASFIDSEDGALVGFSHKQVIGFHAADQEVGA